MATVRKLSTVSSNGNAIRTSFGAGHSQRGNKESAPANSAQRRRNSMLSARFGQTAKLPTRLEFFRLLHAACTVSTVQWLIHSRV